jgi:hypothetical protein
MWINEDGEKTEWAEVIFYPRTPEKEGRPIEMPEEPQKDGYYFNGWEIADGGSGQLSGMLRSEQPLRFMANGFLFFLPEYDYTVNAVFIKGDIPNVGEIDFSKIKTSAKFVSAENNRFIFEMPALEDMTAFTHSLSIRVPIEKVIYHKYNWDLYIGDDTEPKISATPTKFTTTETGYPFNEPTTFRLEVNDNAGGTAAYILKFRFKDTEQAGEEPN